MAQHNLTYQSIHILKIQFERAATVSSEQFTKANTMRNARRRKSLVMFAMNKQMRNSAENSLIGAMNSILFEGKSHRNKKSFSFPHMFLFLFNFLPLRLLSWKI